MVVNKFGYKNLKPWRPVAPPTTAKRQKTQFVAKGVPPVSPKPNGSVYVYVYDSPGSQPGTYHTVSHSGRIPPNAKYVLAPPSNGPQGVEYPRSNECLPPEDGRVTPEVRLKERAKKAGRGYKLLADVNPRNLRSSSKGGKMFIKQKNRMEQFTSMPSDGKQEQGEEPPPAPLPNRDSPWNRSKQSSSSVKYMPSQMMKSAVNKAMKSQHGLVLSPHSEVPPEWRARVESDYFLPDDTSMAGTRRWNVADSYFRAQQRAGLAPREPTYYHNVDNNWEEYQDEPQQFNGTARRALMVNGLPVAKIKFDARQHRVAPHRKQGDLAGRGVFFPPQNCELDFNARAVGWSKAYADQY